MRGAATTNAGLPWRPAAAAAPCRRVHGLLAALDAIACELSGLPDWVLLAHGHDDTRRERNDAVGCATERAHG